MKQSARLRRLQVGQALTEVLVVALALIPILLAMPLLAKFQDMRIASVSASRTAAFDCTVRFEQCRNGAEVAPLADDLRRRHFARHDRDILSRDAMANAAPPSERNGFWVDRRGAALLGDFTDVALQVQAAQSDAIEGAWSGALGHAGTNVLNALSDAVGPGSFGLEPGAGLITARVQARIGAGRTLAAWLTRPDGLALTLAGRTAVMTDAWNASAATGAGDRTISARVDQGRRLPTLGEARAVLGAAIGSAPPGAMPGIDALEPEDALAVAYLPVRELITGPLLAPVEPRGHLFRFHEVDVDLVPADRIGQP